MSRFFETDEFIPEAGPNAPLDAPPAQVEGIVLPALPRFPDVTVMLTGENGNAYFILAFVHRALRNAGHGEVIPQFDAEATSGDYDHLLRTCMAWVNVE